MAEEKNPYLNEDGTIKDNYWDEAFSWARAKELERISKLSPERQKRIREYERVLVKRMNS